MEWQELFKGAVEALYTYGPFAALALFALYVAPRQTKLFLDLSGEQEPAAKLWLCGAVAGMTWLIVAVLTWVIVVSWPPTEVYRGKLGIHPKEVSIQSTCDALYISAREVGRGRFRWQYAVVADKAADLDEEFTFSVTHSLNEYAYDDETLTRAQLAAGRVDYIAGEEDATVEPITAQASVTNGSVDRPLRTAQDWLIRAAYAQEPAPDLLLKDLNDKESKVRAAARLQLRRYSTQTLLALLEDPDQPELVRQQIAKELSRR
ncbi:MAG: hypothetical protein WBM40_11875 [Thiohalocapsa sp.]